MAVEYHTKVMPSLTDSLPQDHEDQMQLGIRIIQSAYQNKVQFLEQEIRGLRMTCEEQRGTCTNLQQKSSALQVELVESHQRSQQLAEENKELFKTVGSLRKQLGRLEMLKNSIISTVQEDDERQAELGDTRATTSVDYVNAAAPLTANYAMGVDFRSLTAGGHPPLLGANRQVHHEPMQQQFSQSLVPSGQIAGGYGGMTSPSFGDAHGVAQHGPGSPAGVPASSPGVIDGKAFFRQARGKLSYEAFNQFLQSIKRLNAQQQTREETLGEARRIFGPSLGELYADFENLLNKQGTM